MLWKKIKGGKGDEFQVGAGCYSTLGGLLPEKVTSQQDMKWVSGSRQALEENDPDDPGDS